CLLHLSTCHPEPSPPGLLQRQHWNKRARDAGEGPAFAFSRHSSLATCHCFETTATPTALSPATPSRYATAAADASSPPSPSVYSPAATAAPSPIYVRLPCHPFTFPSCAFWHPQMRGGRGLHAIYMREGFVSIHTPTCEGRKSPHCEASSER